MIGDFRAYHDDFFSQGYLNSDGKRALVRILRASLQIAFDLKGYSAKRFKKGSEQDVEEILMEIESRLSGAKEHP